MYLHSLSIRDFAALREADVTFDDGLTIVVGDNEAGKSTLLTALRAAFFHRHKANTQAVRDFAPYGRQARPEVSVAFSLAGTRYQLDKSFVTRGEARLEWAGGRLAGDAVEEKLAELLQFAHGAREAKLDQNQGAFGLLWVQQGRAVEGLDLGVGRNALTASLEGEVGEILGGERGRRLLEATKALQDRYFTDTLKTKVSSPLKIAEDRLTELRTRLDERRTAHRLYEERLERLADRRARLAAYRSEDARANAEIALAAAEKAGREAEALEGLLGEARRRASAAEAAWRATAERVERRRLLEAESASAAKELETATAQLAERQERLQPLGAERQAAEARVALAREAEALADRAFEAIVANERRAALDTERLRLEAALAEANEAQRALGALDTAEPSLPLDRKDVARLAEAGRARLEAEIRLNAAATTLVFEPIGEARVRSCDASLEIGAPIVVAAPQRFELDGFGALHVRPGGGSQDVAAMLASAVEAEARLLAKAGVASLADAQRRVTEAEDRQRERTRLRARIAELLPDGLPAAELRLEELRRQLGHLGPAASGDDPATITARRQAARAEREAAAALLERLRASESAARTEIARAEAALVHAQTSARARALELARAEEERGRSALEADLAAADMERRGADVLLAVQMEALKAVDPEAVRLETERARAVLRRTEQSIADLVEQVSRLEGELTIEGAGALNEEIERLSGEIEVLEKDVKRLRLDASASRLLHETLRTAQGRARDHWLGPIRAGIAPYLRLIQPNADLDFDETTLEIRSLNRAGQAEAFARLSHGAREQIAVATRLALAGVLKRAGHPAAVVLDDALVNTDEKRLARMHLILRKAAEELQIVILTCRESDFAPLGARIHRL